MDFGSTRSRYEMWAWWGARGCCSHMCSTQGSISYLHNPLQGVQPGLHKPNVSVKSWQHTNIHQLHAAILFQWWSGSMWEYLVVFLPFDKFSIYKKGATESASVSNVVLSCWEATDEQRLCRLYLGIPVNKVGEKTTKQLLSLIFGGNLLPRKTRQRVVQTSKKLSAK